MCACVCVTTMYGVNSCRHHQQAELMPHGFVVQVQCRLFMCEQLRDHSSSTNKAQKNKTIMPLRAFVCGGEETGNEIMLWALAVCEWSLSKSKARTGGVYESLISWAC